MPWLYEDCREIVVHYHCHVDDKLTCIQFWVPGLLLAWRSCGGGGGGGSCGGEVAVVALVLAVAVAVAVAVAAAVAVVAVVAMAVAVVVAVMAVMAVVAWVAVAVVRVVVIAIIAQDNNKKHAVQTVRKSNPTTSKVLYWSCFGGVTLIEIWEFSDKWGLLFWWPRIWLISCWGVCLRPCPPISARVPSMTIEVLIHPEGKTVFCDAWFAWDVLHLDSRRPGDLQIRAIV